MRQLTFEEAWFKNGRNLSVAGPHAEDFARDEELDYTPRKPRVWLEGGELQPRSHVHEAVDHPVRRLSARRASKSIDQHTQRREELVSFAQQHMGTVRQALTALSPRGVLSPVSPATSRPGSPGAGSYARSPAGKPATSRFTGGGGANHTYGGSVRASATRSSYEQQQQQQQQVLLPYQGMGGVHPANCACGACGGRAWARSTAAGTLAHFGDFMAHNSERLHRAMPEQPYDSTALEAAFQHHQHQQHRSPYTYRNPYGTGDAGYFQQRWEAEAEAQAAAEEEAQAEEREAREREQEAREAEEDRAHLPAYVLRRYSEASGVRDKTMDRVVRAMAASEREAAGLGGGGGGRGGGRVQAASSGGAPPPLSSVRREDPRLARLVSGAELGAGVGCGRQGTPAQRLLAAVRARVAEAAEQRTWREVDPDDDTVSESEGGGRRAADLLRATRRRAHSEVLRSARAGTGAGGVPAAAAVREVGRYSRGLGRSTTSALAARVSAGGGGGGGGAAVPDPRRVSFTDRLRTASTGGGGGGDGTAAAAAASSSVRRGPSTPDHRRVESSAAVALSDDSEDEFSRRLTSAGGGGGSRGGGGGSGSAAAESRRRVADAMGRTVQSLGGTQPPRPATAAAAAASSRGASAMRSSGGGSGGGGGGGGGDGVRSGGSWFLTKQLYSESSEDEASAAREAEEAAEAGQPQRELLSALWAQRTHRTRPGGALAAAAAPAPARGLSSAGAAAVTRQRERLQRDALAADEAAPTPRSRRLTFEDAPAARATGSSGSVPAAAARRHSQAAAAQLQAASSLGGLAGPPPPLRLSHAGSLWEAEAGGPPPLRSPVKLSAEEAAMLAALEATYRGSAGGLGGGRSLQPRPTWAAGASWEGADGGLGGGGGRRLEMLATRISDPTAGMLWGSGGGSPAKGGPAASSGGGGRGAEGGSWAQQAYARVSRAGS